MKYIIIIMQGWHNLHDEYESNSQVTACWKTLKLNIIIIEGDAIDV